MTIAAIVRPAKLLNHQVAHQGGRIVIERVVILGFQMPSLFEACNSKRYFLLGRLVYVARRWRLFTSFQSFSRPTSRYRYRFFSGAAKLKAANSNVKMLCL